MLTRKNYIHNTQPDFIPPVNVDKRPKFICYALKLAKKNDISKNELNYTIKPRNLQTGEVIIRRRKLNKHRVAAMRAIVMAMIYHFNITSNLVQSSVERLADECGLSTISKSGNKSITRASRLISEFMEPMGFVKCRKHWNKILGIYMPKIIFLTPLFFKLIGIPKIILKKAKNDQINWKNRKLVNKREHFLSSNKIINENKNLQKKQVLSSQKNYIFFQKNMKYERKLFMLTKKDIKQKVIKYLISQYSTSELSKIGLLEFKRRVNIEYNYIKKLAQTCTDDPKAFFNIFNNIQ